MSKDIKIKKGLDIKLQGEPTKEVKQVALSNTFIVYPEDFHSIIPKLVVKQGAKVKRGDALFFNKSNEQMNFVSPVSGEVKEIVRGAKRKVLQIVMEADGKDDAKDFGKKPVASLSLDQVKNHLLESGCWSFIKQRPYDVIANPEKEIRDIFISGFSTAPLAVDVAFALQGKKADFQTGIDALAKLTNGKVHLSVQDKSSFLNQVNGVVLHQVTGVHPAGNVGTQINKINPINKGETVLTVNALDVALIGELFNTGYYNSDRLISIAGTGVENASYYQAKIGAVIENLVQDAELIDNVRVISGNVLSGTQSSIKDALRHFDNQITVIPEGNDYELFGWNKPVFNKVSTTRAMTFSWLFPKKKYDLNTNMNGEHRAFVLTGAYEEVFPLDIFPMQILKSCKYKDLDEMEALGMYEVAPEDFALTEFICVSKQPHQDIIRKGLDLMLKEIG